MKPPFTCTPTSLVLLLQCFSHISFCWCWNCLQYSDSFLGVFYADCKISCYLPKRSSPMVSGSFWESLCENHFYICFLLCYFHPFLILKILFLSSLILVDGWQGFFIALLFDMKIVLDEIFHCKIFLYKALAYLCRCSIKWPEIDQFLA